MLDVRIKSWRKQAWKWAETAFIYAYWCNSHTWWGEGEASGCWMTNCSYKNKNNSKHAKSFIKYTSPVHFSFKFKAQSSNYVAWSVQLIKPGLHLWIPQHHSQKRRNNLFICFITLTNKHSDPKYGQAHMGAEPIPAVMAPWTGHQSITLFCYEATVLTNTIVY